MFTSPRCVHNRETRRPPSFAGGVVSLLLIVPTTCVPKLIKKLIKFLS